MEVGGNTIIDYFIINCSNTFETFLNDEGKQFIQRCKYYNIHCVGKNILIHTFSFININDIKHIPLVCKNWNKIFKTSEFWQPFVERKLQEYPLCCQNANFFFKYSPSFRRSFDWIFDKNENIKWQKNNTSGIIFLYLGNSTTIELDNTFSYVLNIVYNNPTTTNISEKYTFTDCLKYYSFTNNPFEVHKIKFTRSDDGISFEGKSNDNEQIEKYDKLLPHGSGTWTFPDGSTFSGDNVAFEGVPHGKGIWNGKEQVEFEFGVRIKEGYKRRKIEWK